MAQGYHIVGTDTGVGKSLVTASLLHGLSEKGEKVVGFKPIASGCEMVDGQLVNEDAQLLRENSSIDVTYQQVNPYALELAASPNIAARHEARNIDLDVIVETYESLSSQSDRVIVEGVGGLQVPLNDTQTYAEVLRRIDLPLIMVVNIKLGCINHALLTYESILKEGFELKGWVANISDRTVEYAPEQIDTIRRRLEAPIVGLLPPLRKVRLDLILNHMSVEQLF